MYSDARAALQLLVDGFKLQPERDIILYGKSIGSCPTCHLASRARVRGVVIVSGLASGSRVLFPTTKVYLMDMLYFHNLAKLGKNKGGLVQLIHGTHDEVIPWSNGADLHHCARDHHPLKPAWIEGATHNNLETVHSVAYMRTFRAFLKHLLSTQHYTPPPKKENWFDFFNPRPHTPTTRVEPNVAATNGVANGPHNPKPISPGCSSTAAAS